MYLKSNTTVTGQINLLNCLNVKNFAKPTYALLLFCFNCLRINEQ